MEYVFRVLKKVVNMEDPSRNYQETKKYYAEINDSFEEDSKHGNVFKLLSGGVKEVVLEYNRYYLVKNEHKGYEYNTTLTINEPKSITSMWGKNQVTLIITYLGILGDTYNE